MHWPTGIENCASGFISHSRSDFVPRIPPIQTEDLEAEWPTTRREIGPIPDLVVTAGNVLEVYVVRVQEEDGTRGPRASGEPKRGGLMDGVSGASLELVCHYRSVALIKPRFTVSSTVLAFCLELSRIRLISYS